MSYDVSPGNVEWVASTVMRAIGDGRFNSGEVIMGVAEALGRIIVNLSDTPVQGISCAQVMEEHIKRTLFAGFTAKGFNMGNSPLAN